MIQDVPIQVMRIFIYEAFHIILLLLASEVFLRINRNQLRFPSPLKPHAVIFTHLVSSYYIKFSSQKTLILLIYSSRYNLRHHAIYEVNLSSESDIICIVFTAFLCLSVEFIVVLYMFAHYEVKFKLYYYFVIILIHNI